jgi:hypothetical protein
MIKIKLNFFLLKTKYFRFALLGKSRLIVMQQSNAANMCCILKGFKTESTTVFPTKLETH